MRTDRHPNECSPPGEHSMSNAMRTALLTRAGMFIDRDDYPIAEDPLLNVDRVLELIPVSRDIWWSGVKSGRFPEPVYLSPRRPVWKRSSIQALINNI